MKQSPSGQQSPNGQQSLAVGQARSDDVELVETDFDEPDRAHAKPATANTSATAHAVKIFVRIGLSLKVNTSGLENI